MNQNYIADETFKSVNFNDKPLLKGTYECCVFNNCDFSNANFSAFHFIECDFFDCNFSSANVYGTLFQNVQFQDCKMLGLPFEKCNSFGLIVSFSDCQLNHSSFYNLNLSKTNFLNCRLINADFTASNLTEVIFENCDLQNAKFENTILEKADFRSSFNYTINPEINKIKGAKFSLKDIEGLLSQYQIKID